MELRVNTDSVKDTTPKFPSTHGPLEVEDGEENGQEVNGRSVGR